MSVETQHGPIDFNQYSAAMTRKLQIIDRIFHAELFLSKCRPKWFCFYSDRKSSKIDSRHLREGETECCKKTWRPHLPLLVSTKTTVTLTLTTTTTLAAVCSAKKNWIFIFSRCHPDRREPYGGETHFCFFKSERSHKSPLNCKSRRRRRTNELHETGEFFFLSRRDRFKSGISCGGSNAQKVSNTEKKKTGRMKNRKKPSQLFSTSQSRTR